MTSFALEPIYGSLLLALAVAVVTVGVILYVTPPTENRTHRRWLIALRLLAAAMLLLAAFRPAFFRTDNRPADAALVVAVDTSRSMTLPDGDGSTRWESQTEVWKRLANSIVGLDPSLNVRLLAYDSDARPFSTVNASTLDSETPDGELTDLSNAALAAMQASEGQPIAGIVLMGDGTQTAPLQGAGAQRVVETLDSLGVPLWTVPIGPAGGASASRDAAIDALPESFQLFAGNQVDIDFQLVTRGMAGIDVPVKLSWISSDGQVSEIATRQIAPTDATQVSSITLPILAPDPGTYRLKVEAVVQDGELVTTNNTQTAFVDVREGGGRILYLEGTPRLEQTFLRRSLRRFPDLDLNYRWIPTDTSGQWPVDLDDAFQPGRYDVYILGDLDAEALGDEQLGELAEAISGGAGLLILGGFQSYGAGGYADSPLADVIPVQMDASRRRSPGVGTVDDETQIAGPLTIELARTHPITDLGGNDLQATWQQLPQLLGANRLLDPKIAPGVIVLLQTQQQDPLLVVGEYGGGRTAALAFDSTWRWWRAGQSEVHRRFWRQLILWLLSRQDTTEDKILIEMDARRFSLEEPPEFRASVQSLDDGGSPLSLIAEVVDESDAVTLLNVSTESQSARSSQPARNAIRGRIPVLTPGFYRLRVRPAQPTDSPPTEELAFQVIDESREMAQPMADPVYLQQLASLTSKHGGDAFPPDEVDELIETIKQRRRQAETPVVERFRLGDGPLSGWILFVLFAGALSAEWFLRKQWGLA
ncbi:MAG: glutamine amidotransferase [Rubripirellula sp.]